jgi:hypothetical protein
MQEIRGAVKRMEIVQEAGDLLFVPSGRYSRSRIRRGGGRHGKTP